jgi:hypothetical protein
LEFTEFLRESGSLGTPWLPIQGRPRQPDIACVELSDDHLEVKRFRPPTPMANGGGAQQGDCVHPEARNKVTACILKALGLKAGRPDGERVELARMCMHQARAASTREVGQELHRMAKEYRRRAAALDDGSMPDIGDD